MLLLFSQFAKIFDANEDKITLKAPKQPSIFQTFTTETFQQQQQQQQQTEKTVTSNMKESLQRQQRAKEAMIRRCNPKRRRRDGFHPNTFSVFLLVTGTYNTGVCIHLVIVSDSSETIAN